MVVLRFTSARDVFDAFPSACEEIATGPTDQPTLVFLRELLKDTTIEDAIPFCAYVLPRREAVGWASQSVRILLERRTAEDEKALMAAEDWFIDPNEASRRRALQIAAAGNQRAASSWVAFAAAWSGGPMLGELGGPLAPPQLTAQAAFTAIRIALGGKPDRARLIKACVEQGIKIMEG